MKLVQITIIFYTKSHIISFNNFYNNSLNDFKTFYNILRISRYHIYIYICIFYITETTS